MWPEPNAEQELRIIRTLGGNSAFHNFENDYGHIEDPSKRRRLALAEIDKVPFGWYHVRAVAVAGIGFFTDSYDIFAINLAIGMIGITFWHSDGGSIPTNVSTAIKTSMAAGTVIGQIAFGWLADVLGRRKIYGIELITLIVATIAQSLTSHSASMSMTSLLIFWRVVMGIGVGGDYPMSAVITSEFAPTKWRGSMMAAVFSMQGAGQLAAALVGLVVTIGFKNSFAEPKASDCGTDCQFAADCGWRIIVGAGALPALWALYYRLTIPETPRYTFDVAQDIEKGDADFQIFKDKRTTHQLDTVERERMRQLTKAKPMQPRASRADFVEYFWNWKNGSVLFATMSTWFFLDLAFYGLGLNNNIVLEAIGYGTSTDSIYHTFFNTAVGNIIVVCSGSLPGYWLSIIFMDILGRKTIQIWGFAILTIIFCIIGFGYNSLNRGALLALYILAQLFFNFGPNTTTFIIPGECFPTRYRATCHGLSAASGKIGAILAQVISQLLLTKDAPPNCKGNDCSPWLPHLMEIFACFMLCGTIISFLVPETSLRTLEELAGEKPVASGSSVNTASESQPKRARFLNWHFSQTIRRMRSPRSTNSNADNEEKENATKPTASGRMSLRDSFRKSISTSSDGGVVSHKGTSVTYKQGVNNQRQEEEQSRSARKGSTLSSNAAEIEISTPDVMLRDVGGLVFKDGRALL